MAFETTFGPYVAKGHQEVPGADNEPNMVQGFDVSGIIVRYELA
jgi:hypothetical protein